MTVIVKDMMLPDCCAVCELSDSDDDGIYCNVLEEFMRFDELPKGRRSDCPLFDENTETIQSIVLNDRYGNIAEYAKVIRCKDCKHRPHKTKDGYTRSPRVQVGVYAWGDPEYDDDLTCPYVCEDTWYSCVPDDEQYCDRAERMETES